MIFQMAPGLSHESETDLRKAFDNCLEIMKRTGDTLCRVETLKGGVGLNAVICVAGEGVTFRAIQAIDRLMDKGEKMAAK